MSKLMTTVIVMGAGLLVGTLFGFVGSAVTGDAGLRYFWPIAGALSALLAWKAANKGGKSD